MTRLVRAAFLLRGLFDVLTGLAWMILPRALGDPLWPSLSPDGGIVLRRTGA